jgi:hypothetical protein
MLLTKTNRKGDAPMAKIISQITFADYGDIEVLGDLERFFICAVGNGRRIPDAKHPLQHSTGNHFRVVLSS